MHEKTLKRAKCRKIQDNEEKFRTRNFIISVMELAGHVTRSRREMRTGYKILIRKREERSSLAREDNLKLNLKEMENNLTGRLYFLRKPLGHGISKLLSK